MKWMFFVAATAVALNGGLAVAQGTSAPRSIEERLEQIERAIARLDERSSQREGGMMDKCQEMMSGMLGGGMMGDGMMGGGMMGGGMMNGGMMNGGERRSPNDQWRDK